MIFKKMVKRGIDHLSLNK